MENVLNINAILMHGKHRRDTVVDKKKNLAIERHSKVGLYQKMKEGKKGQY